MAAQAIAKRAQRARKKAGTSRRTGAPRTAKASHPARIRRVIHNVIRVWGSAGPGASLTGQPRVPAPQRPARRGWCREPTAAERARWRKLGALVDGCSPPAPLAASDGRTLANQRFWPDVPLPLAGVAEVNEWGPSGPALTAALSWWQRRGDMQHALYDGIFGANGVRVHPRFVDCAGGAGGLSFGWVAGTNGHATLRADFPAELQELGRLFITVMDGAPWSIHSARSSRRPRCARAVALTSVYTCVRVRACTDHLRWRMEAAEPGSYAAYAKMLGLDPRMHLHGSPLFTSVWCGN